MNTGRRLGRPDILFWVMPWLMILLIIGTVAQKNIGLYDAQHIYFSSFYFLWHGVPLPGGYSVIAIMAVNLMCKFIFSSPWSWDKAGIHIVHLAVIILLLGGLLTAMTMQEGYIALRQGEQKSFITDYQKRVLSFDYENGQSIVVAFDDLAENKSVIVNDWTITPVRLCRHIEIIPKPDATGTRIGAAAMFDIECAKPLTDSEQNIAGMIYRVLGGDELQNGIYAIFENRQTHDVLTSADGRDYTITMRRDRRDLPFAVELKSFHRPVYSGTDMARDYQSQIRVHDGLVNWPALITMNEPLRYKGYTFYQASTWMDEDGEPVSVLSVVTNSGWVFPYVSGIFLTIGLLYHVVIRLRSRR